MQGIEKQHSSFVSMFVCIAMVIFSVLFFYIPPIAGAAGYTALVMIVYRISYQGYLQVYPEASNARIFIVSIISAALWPLYFLFGACVFLGMVIKGE